MKYLGLTGFIKLVIEVFFQSAKDTSGGKKLNEVDFAKLVRNALIYGGGAILAYIVQYLSGVDYGVYTPLVAGGLAGVLDALRRMLKQN